MKNAQEKNYQINNSQGQMSKNQGSQVQKKTGVTVGKNMGDFLLKFSGKLELVQKQYGIGNMQAKDRLEDIGGKQ